MQCVGSAQALFESTGAALERWPLFIGPAWQMEFQPKVGAGDKIWVFNCVPGENLGPRFREDDGQPRFHVPFIHRNDKCRLNRARSAAGFTGLGR